MISKMVCITLTIALASLALTSAAWATCSNASVTGIYGFVGGGTDSGDIPTATLLQLSFDPTTPTGKFIGTEITSRDGVIEPPFSISGTYEVASNCTATGTYTIGGKTHPYSGVVTSTGGLKIVDGKTGATIGGVEVAKGSPTCTLAGLAGNFGLDAKGVFVTGAPFTGPLALIGELELSVKDGKGVISGEVAGSENGMILTFEQRPVTGSYSVNATNCTGTATITPEGKPALQYSFVVVNSGKELLAIETDEHTVVTATLQR